MKSFDATGAKRGKAVCPRAYTVILMRFWNITVKSDQLYDGREIALILSGKGDDVNIQRFVCSA